MIHLPKNLEIEPISLPKISGRFPSRDSTPERVFQCIDPEDGKIWGFLVVDNTVRGPGLGGIRMIPDITLTEVRRLAYLMTLKNSLAQLPLGGGKVGVALDAEVFRNKPKARAEFFSIFADALFNEENYIPAPDMGTNESDIQTMYEILSGKLGTYQHGRGGASRPENMGGIPIDAWGLTAHGLFASTRSLEEFNPKFSIKGSHVVVQGYGNVGSAIAQKLFNAGAIIIGASDINAALWHQDGLNLEELNRVRLLPGGLGQYEGPETQRFFGNRLDYLLEVPCDLLIPCARPDSISSRNADRIECQFILQGANTPCNKMTEYYLWNRRGILSLSDIVVNAGGVIGCAIELRMTMDKKYKNKIQAMGVRQWVEDRVYQTVAKNVSEVFRRLENNGEDIIFREEAKGLALERLKGGSQEIWL